jgi:hypothetical protein
MTVDVCTLCVQLLQCSQGEDKHTVLHASNVLSILTFFAQRHTRCINGFAVTSGKKSQSQKKKHPSMLSGIHQRRKSVCFRSF